MGDKLPFPRDRLVGSFFWTLWISRQPRLKYCREVLTNIIELIGVYSDVLCYTGWTWTLYQCRGQVRPVKKGGVTIVILIIWQLRWVINSMKGLPDYIKLGFMSLYKFVTETSLRHPQGPYYRYFTIAKKMGIFFPIFILTNCFFFKKKNSLDYFWNRRASPNIVNFSL